MEDKNQEIKKSAADGVADGAFSTVKRKKPLSEIFTYERLFIIMAVVFGLIFIGAIIPPALNKYLHWYDSDAQANLAIMQNLRCGLIIFVPIIFEKCFGVRVDLKIIFMFYLFGICSTVLGETFKVYYMTVYWDKSLHAISGAMTFYVAFGFGQMFLRTSTGKHKFGAALFIGFLGSMAVASIWEILEFGTDMVFGTDMQKFIPQNGIGGTDSFQDLIGTNEEIAEFFRHPEGYHFALMDTMMDMIYCLGGTTLFMIVMLVVKRLKNNAFENSVIYNKNFRFGFIKKKSKAVAEAVATSDSVDSTVSSENVIENKGYDNS